MLLANLSRKRATQEQDIKKKKRGLASLNLRAGRIHSSTNFDLLLLSILNCPIPSFPPLTSWPDDAVKPITSKSLEPKDILAQHFFLDIFQL